MVRLERFERPTYGFVVRCSIQLSYKRIGIGFIAHNSDYFNLFLFIITFTLQVPDFLLPCWCVFGYSYELDLCHTFTLKA